MTDPVLKRCRELFGPATVFIPLCCGQNTPVDAKWEETTLESSQSTDHLNLLRHSDLAVVCGQVSDQLCGLHFMDSAAYAQFRELNPGLATLTMQVPEGIWIWFRIIGFSPGTQPLPDGSWHSDGAVKVHQRHSAGSGYKVLDPAEPVVAPFDCLQWGRQTRSHLRGQVVAADYGEAFEPAANGKLRPNHAFWARYFSLEDGILFDPAHQCFYCRDPEAQAWTGLAVECVQNRLIRFLMHFKKDKNYARVASLAQPDELKKLLLTLRAVSAGELPANQDAMAQFLNDCVEADPTGTATTRELFPVFKDYCARKKLVAMPQAIFERVIGALLTERFGVCKSHSIERNGTDRRGFNEFLAKWKKP